MKNSQSFWLSDLQLWVLYFSRSGGKFFKASDVQVTSHHFTKFVDNSTSVGDQPWYLSRDHHKGLWFLDSDSILILAAMNRCTSLWNLPLFTPVMCVNTADRLPAAVNTECVKVPLPREKTGGGGVWGIICRIKRMSCLSEMPFVFYSQVKAFPSARDLTLAHVECFLNRQMKPLKLNEVGPCHVEVVYLPLT